MIEGELREKYIANMKKYYLESLKYSDECWISTIKSKHNYTGYRSVEEYEPKNTRTTTRIT